MLDDIHQREGKPGRPTSYTQGIADEICDRLADGKSLREACSLDHLPAESTVRSWAVRRDHPFSAQYACAREVGYHAMADDILEIADDASNDWMKRNDPGNEGWVANGENVQRSRLRVEARKWMLSKVLPKLYGDRIAVAGDPASPMSVNIDIASEIMATISASGRFDPARTQRENDEVDHAKC